MSQDYKLSRRAFIGGIAAAMVSSAPSAAQAFDFLGNNRSQTGNVFGVQPGSNGGATRAPSRRDTCRADLQAYETSYSGNAAVGSILISINDAQLYHIHSAGRATVYPIGAGDASRELVGQTLTIQRSQAWPTWTPTANMRRRDPSLPRQVAGGPDNPLGAHALYLYDANGRDTIYRIHGTNDPCSIGKSDVSSGCVRMYDHHVQRLATLVRLGVSVSVNQGSVPGIGNNRRERRLTNG